MLPAGHPYSEIITRVLKPGRYTGGEHNVVRKDPAGLRCRIALSYPDVYDIGMSHMGLKILYSIVNRREDFAAERVFSPWPDMERELRAAGLPLLTLESAARLSEFDILGFSLQFELTYSNILQILDLGGVPMRADERGDGDPLVIGGGPLAFTPEPLVDFFDLFLIGDGEQALPELMDDWADLRDAGVPRAERLRALAGKPGRYLPALYETHPDPDTGITVVTRPANDDLPFPIARAIVENIDDFPFPTDTPVPESSAIFDRHGIELARGCTEGCRFCQAGMIYRPVRERSPKQVIETVMAGLRESGYDEVSLTSLSTADYSAIQPLIKELVARLEKEKVSLAVSSLRAYGLPEALLDEIQKVRATSLTFAPEAGTQRLRDVINKNITEEQILESAQRVFSRKWDHMKLYFMIGLPTETEADLQGIVDVGRRCQEIGARIPERNRPARVTCSVSSHVPKPHTPFQWCAMDSAEQLKDKQRRLRHMSRGTRIDLRLSETGGSVLEGILTRGDRPLGALIRLAYEKGARFDSWDECFDASIWNDAMQELGIDPAPYLGTLPVDARLSWDHLDPGVTYKFLLSEYRRSMKDRLSPPCGKPKGATLHPGSLAEAEAVSDQKLICFHCGVACDLDGMKRERADFHREFDSLGARAAEREESPSLRYRLIYRKLGPATTLSHLDLVRLWPRALRRAGLPVAYSLGYHPHPLLSYTPALPMGAQSLGEQVEIKLEIAMEPADVIAAIEPTLPEGIEIIECFKGEDRPLSKRLLSSTMLVEFSGGTEAAALAGQCAELLASDSIQLKRERKRKLVAMELRPTLLDLRPAGEDEYYLASGEDESGYAPNGDGRRVIVKLSVLGAGLKASELVALLGGDPEQMRIQRLGFELEEMERAGV